MTPIKKERDQISICQNSDEIAADIALAMGIDIASLNAKSMHIELKAGSYPSITIESIPSAKVVDVIKDCVADAIISYGLAGANGSSNSIAFHSITPRLKGSIANAFGVKTEVLDLNSVETTRATGEKMQLTIILTVKDCAAGQIFDALISR